jgi:hypothetical protein
VTHKGFIPASIKGKRTGAVNAFPDAVLTELRNSDGIYGIEEAPVLFR